MTRVVYFLILVGCLLLLLPAVVNSKYVIAYLTEDPLINMEAFEEKTINSVGITSFVGLEQFKKEHRKSKYEILLHC